MRKMLISASRRTDIPAFYAEWFSNRLRAGFCSVPNPFNARQVSRVSLAPVDVAGFVFWTRSPRPFSGCLDELDRLGFAYSFQFTLLGSPRWLDPKTPPLEAALASFTELADRLGPERVVWRYDPIVLGGGLDEAAHLESFRRIAARLEGRTRRCVISFLDDYPKARRRLRPLQLESPEPGRLRALASGMVGIAALHGIEVQACAEPPELLPEGCRPGRCVDPQLLEGAGAHPRKDPHQREACGCPVSKDIGMYDACLFGCQYCYATSSFERARANYEERHDPASPSLLGWFEPTL